MYGNDHSCGHGCGCGSHKGLVENQIGSAYGVVKEVRDSLPQVRAVAEYVLAAGGSANAVELSAQLAEDAARRAKASEEAAANSATQAGTSAGEAQQDAASAQQSASAAAESADEAAQSAATSATAAQNRVTQAFGLQDSVPFAAGIAVSPTTTVTYGGATYAAVAGSTPFTTTGTFNPAQWQAVKGLTAEVAAGQIGDPTTPIGRALLGGFKPIHASVGMAGRGKIAIVVDDGHPDQFTDLLPISKRLGFPMGLPWHTSYNNPAQVAEAYAAGWEIQSHLPSNVDARSLTPAQLEAAAIETRDAIAAITGSPDNIAFVYPQHLRNDATDSILSKFYTYGRGRGERGTNTRGGHTWLVGAYPLDTSHHDNNGVLDKRVEEHLRTISATDGTEVFYIHYMRGTVYQGVPKALENFVKLARSYGIQIVRPSDVRGNRRILPRWLSPGGWNTPAGVTLTDEHVYGSGLSLKFTPPATGTWNDMTAYRGDTYAAQIPAGFGIYRFTLRYKAEADIPTSGNALYAGIGVRATLFCRTVSSSVNLGVGGLYTKFPVGSVIPAADWQRISFVFALPPSVGFFNPAIHLGHAAAGAPPVYFGDIEIVKVDHTASMSFEVTLAGATDVVVDTRVLGLQAAGCGVSITPMEPLSGRVHFRVISNTNSGIRVASSDAADAGKKVLVTVTPGPSYTSYDIPPTVA